MLGEAFFHLLAGLVLGADQQEVEEGDHAADEDELRHHPGHAGLGLLKQGEVHSGLLGVPVLPRPLREVREPVLDQSLPRGAG